MVCIGADDLMPRRHLKTDCKARAFAGLPIVMSFRVIVNVPACQLVIICCRCLEGAFPLKTCLFRFSGSSFTERYALIPPVDENDDSSPPALSLSVHP